MVPVTLGTGVGFGLIMTNHLAASGIEFAPFVHPTIVLCPLCIF